ncbi:MAG: OmpA family protein [Bacteroidota bacterium]|nr:OmpA family protein [Bacteroidota bacterium]
MTIRIHNPILTVLLLCALILLPRPRGGDAVAQEMPRFPGRTVLLSAGGGLGAISGEFQGGFSGTHAALGVGYAVYPELMLMLTADVGRWTLTRARTQVDPLLYDFQFLAAAAGGEVERGVRTVGLDFSVRYNLFPDRWYNAFASIGGGVTFYQADDFSVVRLRPSADFPASISIPLALGGEYFLTRDLALALQLRWFFHLNGDLDAFDPEEVAIEYNRRRPTRISVPEHAGDHLLMLTVGVEYTLFESVDYDGDLLPNTEELELGTDPVEIDTDVDGLTDYAEARRHGTNPLKPDTDDDGLGDYFEIMRYNTNPLKPDTDDDRLTDAEEVLVYDTDPLKPDTDDDMLSDYEEVILHQTNPRNPDTDYDGLDDFAEVKVHETNPLRPDTDDDGIYDFNEVVTYNTNPRAEDSDDDRLLDYDEIAYYGTNPLNADTDGDRVDDATEVGARGRSTLADDQHARASERTPFAERPRYHAELLETRSLPGGGTSYLIAPATTRHIPRAPESIDSVIAALAVIDSSAGSGDHRARREDPASRTPERGATAYTRYRRRSVQHITPTEDHGSPARPGATPLRIDSLRLKAGDVLSFCNITFAFDRDALQEEYVPLLRETAQLFHIYPRMTVEIRGHTDDLGDAAYNQTLSERRAGSVRAFLIDEGIAEARLRAIGLGEAQPIAEGETDESRARNRRVEFHIISIEGSGTSSGTTE